MIWICPLPLRLVCRTDPAPAIPSFGTTWLPLLPHPGAFGARRRHHTHEGVDLYAPPGTQVSAVEAGTVVRIESFTGPAAQTPWWLDTQAVFIEGASGVVVYGELLPLPGLAEGQVLEAGEGVGTLVPVLRQDKGRPMTMLHLELHKRGTRSAPAWEGARPPSLEDPTPYLRPLAHDV